MKNLKIRIALCAVLAASTLAAHSEAPKRVIMVVVDCLSARHLHYMGYERQTSPWLDEVAKQSVNFELAIAPSDSTGSSVPAYFTGKYTSVLRQMRGRILSTGATIPKEVKTFAEVFKSKGYQNTAWVTNPVVGKRALMNQGFHEFHEILPLEAPRATIDDIIRIVKSTYTPSAKPELLYIHTMDVHTPYVPPVPFETMFIDSYKGKHFWRGGLFGTEREDIRSNLPYYSEHHNLTQEDIDFFKAQYDGSIAYTDNRLPVLLDALNYRPGEDMLIVTSDHGEGFFEHNFKGHKKATHIEELHVPLLISYKDFLPAKRQYPVSLLDLMPTFCDLLEVEEPKGLFGRSLLPDLMGNPKPVGYVCAEGEDVRGPTGVLISQKYLYWMNTRVHLYVEPTRVWPVREYLFDLEKDPDCQNDLMKTNQDIADVMNAELRKRYPRLQSFAPDRIRREDSEVKLSNNLFAPAEGQGKDWELSSEGETFKKAKNLTMLIRNVTVKAQASIKDVGKAHVLELQYSASKWTRFTAKLRDKKSDKVFWTYKFYKERDKVKTFRAVVYPPSEEVELEIELHFGRLFLRWPKFQKAHLPVIPVKPWRGVKQSATQKSPEDNLSEAQKERMKALGYVQ